MVDTTKVAGGSRNDSGNTGPVVDGESSRIASDSSDGAETGSTAGSGASSNRWGEFQAPPAMLAGQGPAAGTRFVLEQPLTIVGRAEDCDVRVDDPLASRRHAEIRREPWRYVLIDLGSLNGTQVNGETVRGPVQLQHGDVVLVAATPLRFEDPDATIAVGREALRHAHLPVWVNASAAEAYAFGRRLELTPKELALLSILYEHAGAVCDKDEIGRAVWPEYDGIVSDYNIETLVSRLRHKLDSSGAGPDTIVTIKKRGYRLASSE